MAGTNNFQIWNPNAVNQESDAAYTADAMRSGGAPAGSVFPSPTANKLFFQVSTMCAAIAYMMAQKNYNMSDTNGVNLATALANILTNNDIAGKLVQFTDFTKGNNANGYWVKDPVGTIRQWGSGGAGSNPVNITFPTPFTNAASIIVVVSPRNYGTGATRNVVYRTGAPTVSGFSAQTDASTCAFDWVAFGY